MRVLLARYPRLAASMALADLGVQETPVEWWRVDGVALLVKRDDVSAPSPGGNKVRALELLLAGLAPGRELLTVGASGSTHALAVAEHGARLGARTQVITWPQERNAVAEATARRLSEVARVTPARSAAEAYLRAVVRRLRGGVHWVPAGGSVPLGALGHVNAALELVMQLARLHLAVPDVIVAPLGSGGTVAGLVVGLALAGAPTRVIGVRVVPRIVANRSHVLRLARRTRALIARKAEVSLPPLDSTRLVIHDGAYGGAYGRETAPGRAAAQALRDAGGPVLDATYSAKSFGVALELARRVPDERVLFWLTFDGRWLAHNTDVPPPPRPDPAPRTR